MTLSPQMLDILPDSRGRARNAKSPEKSHLHISRTDERQASQGPKRARGRQSRVYSTTSRLCHERNPTMNGKFRAGWLFVQSDDETLRTLNQDLARSPHRNPL
jgi:hypothetical protein